MRLSALAAVVVASAVLTIPAQAQKNCVDKTCRIGTAEPLAAVARPTTSHGSASSDSAKFVYDSRGVTFYKVGCFIANSLPAEYRRYFKAEADAKAAGLTRSKEKGC